MNEKTELGFVTANGIWVEGCNYSCSLAVRQQWFKHVEQIGWWPVPVKYQEEMPEHIILLLQDGTIEKCARIDAVPMNSKKLESYYIEFQKLVKLRRQRQSRRPKDN